jgi:hypothetical protein
MGLGALVEAAASSTSIKKILESTYTSVEHVAWLTAESWMRASRLAEICPREEVLVSIRQIPREREMTADGYITLETGKALHHQLQHSILPDAGLLLGEWSCERCGKHYGVRKPSEPVESYAVKRPHTCSWCGNDTFRFHEYSLYNSQYRITGHPDGLLSIPGLPGLGVLEAKSINAKGGWEVQKVPKLDHVVQAHIYMWFTGLGWSKILYWDKGEYGLVALVEHLVERNDDTIEEIKSLLDELWVGLRTQIPPASRICSDPSAPRAKKCVVCVPCFESSALPPKEEMDV